jgi:hypothetical protein
MREGLNRVAFFIKRGLRRRRAAERNLNHCGGSGLTTALPADI